MPNFNNKKNPTNKLSKLTAPNLFPFRTPRPKEKCRTHTVQSAGTDSTTTIITQCVGRYCFLRVPRTPPKGPYLTWRPLETPFRRGMGTIFHNKFGHYWRPPDLGTVKNSKSFFAFFSKFDYFCFIFGSNIY